MNKEHTIELCNTFPKLYSKVKPKPGSEEETFIFHCKDGWYNLIYVLSKNLTELIEKFTEEIQDNYYITYIGEKYGGLRIYMVFSTDDMYKEIKFVEDLSMKICEHCGNQGKCRNVNDWLFTLCDSCYNEMV